MIAAAADPYVAYTRRFFGRWSPLYDAFAAPIAPVYRATARAAVAGGDPVLDLATGTGEVALRCARAGAAVTAVDLTPSMLLRARAKAAGLPVAFRLMDARRLAFPDGAFATAVLSFALHDMPRRVRREALAEAARVARRVVVVDYRLPAPRALAALWRRTIASFESAYFPAFIAEGAEPLFREAGLKVVSFRSFGGMPFGLWEVSARVD